MGFRIFTFLLFFSLVASPTCLAEKPLHERIDALIERGAEDFAQAELTDDAEFFRRVKLDFAGVIPSADETRSFLADSGPDKRERLIEQLLNGSRYAPAMRDRFHVLLMERRGDNDLWLAWLEDAFARNKPWDVMAREMIRADFRDEPNRGAAYFLSQRLEKYGQNETDYSGLTRDVGRLMLGKDLQCAECHHHLLIKDYRQIDFQGLYAGFANLKLLREDYPAVEEKLMETKHEYVSVFVGQPREVALKVPGRDEIEVVTYEEGQAYVQVPDRKTKTPGIPRFSPLEQYALGIPRSPTFDANIVNRIWFLMMGRGLVMPLDEFHSENPSSHPELLELLALEFSKSGYDFKWLFRELALTKTYQRSSELPDGAQTAPEEKFVVAIERRLSAEQLLASTLRAVGVPASAAPLEDVEAEGEEGEDFVGLETRFVEAYSGEPSEPEQEFSPGLKGALFAMNDEVLHRLLMRDDALPARLVKETEGSTKIAESLFLHVFSRLPEDGEVSDVASYLSAFPDDRHQAIVDVLWAMLSSTEFVVNH